MKAAIRIFMFIAVLGFCAAQSQPVSAGPIDNANEFLEKTVEKAEERNYPAADQPVSEDVISFPGNSSNDSNASNGEGSSPQAENQSE